MPFPFEVGFDEVRANLDGYVDAVFGCLESEFLVMPKGKGFVEFPAFEAGMAPKTSLPRNGSVTERRIRATADSACHTPPPTKMSEDPTACRVTLPH